MVVGVIRRDESGERGEEKKGRERNKDRQRRGKRNIEKDRERKA